MKRGGILAVAVLIALLALVAGWCSAGVWTP